MANEKTYGQLAAEQDPNYVPPQPNPEPTDAEVQEYARRGGITIDSQESYDTAKSMLQSGRGFNDPSWAAGAAGAGGAAGDYYRAQQLPPGEARDAAVDTAKQGLEAQAAAVPAAQGREELATMEPGPVGVQWPNGQNIDFRDPRQVAAYDQWQRQTQQQRARNVGGGGGYRPVDFTSPLAGQQIGDLEDPTAFRARQRSDRQSDIAKLGVSALGLSEADAAFMARAGLKPPGDVAKDLAAQVERGELSPEEAKRRGEAYRKGYSELQAKEKADEGKAKRYEQTWQSSEGLGTRLAGSQMAGQREVGEATRDMATIGADESERQAQMAQKQSAYLDQQARDEEKAAKAYQARRQAGQIHLEELGKKIDEGTPSISKFWSKEGNVGATVASVLGTLIGQVAQGVAAGGENAWTMTGQVASPSSKLDMSKLDGMALLERIVDRDLDEQQRELDTRKGEYDRELNFMAMGREAFGDDQLARQSARAAMLSQMAAESQAIAQQADSEKQRVAADLTSKQLDRMAQEQQLQFDLTLAQQAELAKQRAMQAAAAAGAARARAANAQAMVGKVQFSQDPELVKRYSPIVGGFLRDPSSPITQDQLKRAAVLGSISQDINELNTLLNTPGSATPGSQLGARIEALAMAVQQKFSVAQGMGAMSEDEAARAKSMIPEGGVDVLNRDPTRIKATGDYVNRMLDTTKAGISYTPGTVALRPDENGVYREYAAFDPGAATGTLPEEGSGVKVGKQTYYEGTNEELARGRQANARFVPLKQQPGAAK